MVINKLTYFILKGGDDHNEDYDDIVDSYCKNQMQILTMFSLVAQNKH